MAHPGAIYLHRGRQWRVERLDLDAHEAVLVEADDSDEYTQARTEIDISIVAEDHSSRSVEGSATSAASRSPTGSSRTNASASRTTRCSRSSRSTSPAHAVDAGLLVHRRRDPRSRRGRAGRVLGTVHAAEHGLIGLLPLFAICDRWDVGGVSMAEHPATGEPTIFVYDGFPGGAGIAELAFSELHRHVAATRDLVAACPCDDGCPSCVQSPKCGNWNEHLDKHGAVRLLKILSETSVTAEDGPTTPGVDPRTHLYALPGGRRSAGRHERRQMSGGRRSLRHAGRPRGGGSDSSK